MDYKLLIHGNSGQITVFGKRRKELSVLLRIGLSEAGLKMMGKNAATTGVGSGKKLFHLVLVIPLASVKYSKPWFS